MVTRDEGRSNVLYILLVAFVFIVGGRQAYQRLEDRIILGDRDVGAILESYVDTQEYVKEDWVQAVLAQLRNKDDVNEQNFGELLELFIE